MILQPKRDSDKAGFVDDGGKWVVDPVYDDVDVFREGVAWVKVGDQWGLIDSEGTLIIEPKYEAIREFNDGMANVCLNGLWGVVDKRGKIVVSPEFEAIFPFNNGIAVVRRNGKYGFVFLTDHRIIPPVYHNVHEFSEGLAAVQLSADDRPFGLAFVDNWGFINENGEIVIPADYFMVMCDFSDGRAFVWIHEGGHPTVEGYIDRQGNCLGEFVEIEEPYFDYEEEHFETRYFYGYIDRTGKYLVPPKFQKAWRFNNGLAKVKIDNKYGLIDTTGAYVVEPQREDVTFQNAGLMKDEGMSRIQQRGDYFGFKDSRSGDVIAPVYDYAYEFSDGFAVIRLTESQLEDNPALGRASFLGEFKRAERDGKYGYVNQKGEWVIEAKFDDVKERFTEGYAFVKEGGKWGFINFAGQYVVPPTYDDEGSEDYGFIDDCSVVFINGEKRNIDTKGCFYIDPTSSQPAEQTDEGCEDLPF